MSRIRLVSMLLLPLVCVVVRSVKQFCLQCTLETAPFVICADVVTPVSSVRHLGINLNSDLSTLTVTATEAPVSCPLLEDRQRITESLNPYPGARKQKRTKMFSDHDETSLSIAVVSTVPTVLGLFVIGILL